MSSSGIQSLYQSYINAQTQYRATGNVQFKPAADAAKNAIEEYIATLSRTARDRETAFQNYVNARAGSGNEIDKLAEKAREVRENTDKIAGKYIVSKNLNEDIPIDWTQYYAKFAILGGLMLGAAAGAFIR
jgi:hypothetical protein